MEICGKIFGGNSWKNFGKDLKLREETLRGFMKELLKQLPRELEEELLEAFLEKSLGEFMEKSSGEFLDEFLQWLLVGIHGKIFSGRIIWKISERVLFHLKKLSVRRRFTFTLNEFFLRIFG